MSDWASGLVDAFTGGSLPTTDAGDTAANFAAGAISSGADSAMTYVNDILSNLSSSLVSSSPDVPGSDWSAGGPAAMVSNTGTVATQPGPIERALSSLQKSVGWKDSATDPNGFTKAVGTLGASAIAGLGKGYMEAQKNKLLEDKLKTDQLLAQSQAALNEAKTKQNLSGLKFNAPQSNGIIGSRFQLAPLYPASSRG